MTADLALKSAYAVTVIIELAYVWYLVARYRRVRREMRDLERSK